MVSSFHQTSLSAANINTVLYPKPYPQYEIPTIPAVVTSKVLLPQSNIVAAFVHCRCNLFSDASLDLPKYKKQGVTKFTVVFS